jgi:hypothetical protein
VLRGGDAGVTVVTRTTRAGVGDMGKKRRCTWMSLGERVGDKFKAGVELRTKRAMTRASLDCCWTKWRWKNQIDVSLLIPFNRQLYSISIVVFKSNGID